MTTARALAGLAFALAASQASAQAVTATDPSTVVQAIRDYGHKAKLETDEEGFPIVRVEWDDINYSVHFYGCQGTTGCKDIQFVSSFDVEPALDAAFANDWNGQWAAGRVDVDESGDPYLTYFATTAGGLSADNFRGIMDLWTTTLSGFVDDIGW